MFPMFRKTVQAEKQGDNTFSVIRYFFFGVLVYKKTLLHPERGESVTYHF